MITGNPTSKQLEEAQEVIEWLTERTKKTEPYAKGFISAGEIFASQMPVEAEDII